MSAPPCRLHERRRSGERDPRAERHQRVDVRARDATVQDVAHDRDALALEITERLAERERIEQSLGWMCVRSVAGIDDRSAGASRDEVGGTRARVPHDEHVAAESFERARCVIQRLALLE